MHHHHEHFWWRFFPRKELKQVYVSVALRAFALSLIALFVPLYLYIELGYSLAQTLNFFIFYSVIFAVFTPLAAKFAARYGIKHSILLSVPFYLAFIVLLYLLPKIETPLVLISGLMGLSQAFYWMGMHLVFYRSSHHDHRGEEFGKQAFFSILPALFGPLVGGFLIKFVGFNLVFVFVSLVLLSSALFLFLSREKHIGYRFSIRSIFNKDHWKNSLFFVSLGVRVIALGVVWPLLVFLILKDYFSLGMVGALLSGVSAALLWLTGKYSDRIDKRKIIRWAASFESVSWFLRALVSTAGQIFGVTIFGAISYGALESPLGALQYDKAKTNPTAYFVSREVFICLGRVLLLVFVLMTDSLSGGMVFTGVANLAAWLF